MLSLSRLAALNAPISSPPAYPIASQFPCDTFFPASNPADPSDQADIPQDRQKQIEMLVADLVKHSGNGFRKNPIRIHMSKHKMNQEEYNSSFKYLYENFKGSELSRINSLLYGIYSDKTVGRKTIKTK
jgi:hypothetical protein